MSSSGSVAGAYSNASNVSGDVGNDVAVFFAERGNEAAKKTQEALDKAKRDAFANKTKDSLTSSAKQDGQDGGKASIGKPGQEFLKAKADAETAAGTPNGPYNKAYQSSLDGTISKEEYELYSNSIEADFKNPDRGVNDDSVNLTLVQIAYQEYTNALNGASASAKSTGDTKKSMTDRMQ